MLATNIGPEGKKFAPYVFSLFMFILAANMLGMLPVGIFGLHPFTVTSHFTITGVLAILSFSIVLVVGFWRHTLHFFSLRSEEHTSELQSLLRIPYANFGLKKKTNTQRTHD